MDKEAIRKRRKRLEICVDVLLEVYGDPKFGTPEFTVISELMRKKTALTSKELEGVTTE